MSNISITVKGLDVKFLRDSKRLVSQGLTEYFLSGTSLKEDMIFYLCFEMN